MTQGLEAPGQLSQASLAQAPLQTHELRIDLTPDDQPEDRFSTHVNNARYFAFINRTFHGWYMKMGIRGEIPDYSAAIAHVSYDFLRQVQVPGVVLCRIMVTRVGRSSLEHGIEIWDVGGEPVLAGRGHAIHVWVERASGKPLPWPAEVLAKCMLPADGPGRPGQVQGCS